ncbi:MAG TPA: ATP-dependent DNA helicase, partial [Aquimonas sp.]|nr:ATP-dependent DNA helicase [Aquimonas sp.]
ILPGAHAFIIDEAHQWPELAVQFFSETLSSRQLLDLARDAQSEAQSASAALGSIQPAAQALERCVRELRLAWEPLPSRAPLSLALAHDPCVDSLDALDVALAELLRALEPQCERSPGLAACAERAAQFEQRLQRLHSGNEATAQVRWFELSPRGFSFQRTPLDVSAPLAEFRQRTGAAWVFTSATLAVDGRFEHFAKQLGADTPRTLLEQSPFDYATQALAWLPSDLPDPAQRDYVPCLLQTVLPVLQASRGRAFLLFTSHRALREASDWLAVNADFPLFVQGSLPKNRLLQAFRQSGNGLLLGAASFWEGVDVAGTALSVVVIDKLPFAAPDDPVLEARLASIRAEGGNPFVDWQIPAAVIALKQGVGRLIRSETDRGLLVLCDPRLQRRSYGRSFLRSLPPFPLTRDREVAARFVADC